MEKTKIFKHCAICCLSIALLSSCNDESTAIHNDSLLADATFQEMIEAVDHRDADKLTPFFTHQDTKLARLAVLQSASFIDSTLNTPLIQALNSEDLSKQISAAYALGQQFDTSLYVPLRDKLKSSTDYALRFSIFTALGKTCPLKHADELQQLIIAEDCASAPMWGAFFRLPTVRSWIGFEDKAIESLACHNYEARLAAANFLSRTREVNLLDHLDQLIDAYKNEDDARVKMAIALAMRHCPHPEMADFINQEIAQTNDERILVNLLRSGSRLNILEIDVLLPLIQSDQVGVAMNAINAIDFNKLDIEELALVRDRLPEDVTARASVLRKLAKSDDKTQDWYDQLVSLSSSRQSSYEKAACMQELKYFPEASSYILLHIDTSMALPVLSTAADVIMQMHSAGDFDGDFKIALSDMIDTKDAGVLALVGIHLQSHPDDMDASFLDRLKRIQANLPIPQEVETYNYLEDAIAEFEERDSKHVTPEWNHPIDFNLLTSHADTIDVEVVTNKGTIKLELYPLNAPGSVGSFIQLAEDGFYNGKSFHRVVPNFVIQGGCPRGDGWGGVNYSIRSEFAMHDYDEGTLGMASAGNDTESCQWFITHSPTPHLEGRYSIFGQVISAMDVVREVHVGSTIEEIKILN